MELLRLVVWLVFCLVFVTTQSSRPTFVLASVVVLRLVLPSTSGSLLIGDWEGNGALHPATVLLGAYCLFGMRGGSQAIAAEVGHRRGWYAGLAIVAFLLVVEAVVGSGPTSLLGLTNAVLAPILLCVAARVQERVSPGSLRRLALVFVGTMVVVAVLVVLQSVSHSDLPWGTGPVTGQFRPRGTFDSALDLGFAASIAIPLTAFVRPVPARLVTAMLLLSAVVLSASRVPTVVAVVGFAWILVRTTRSFAAIVTAMVSCGAAVLVVTRTTVLDGLVERLTGDDGSSSSARGAAAQYVLDHVWDHTLVGGGWGAAWALKGTVLRTSLENSYAILAFDLGLVPVVALVVLQLVPALRSRAPVAARIAVVAGITLGFCYSGFATMSAASTVLWLALALCTPAAGVARAAPDVRGVVDLAAAARVTRTAPYRERAVV